MPGGGLWGACRRRFIESASNHGGKVPNGRGTTERRSDADSDAGSDVKLDYGCPDFAARVPSGAAPGYSVSSRSESPLGAIVVKDA